MENVFIRQNSLSYIYLLPFLYICSIHIQTQITQIHSMRIITIGFVCRDVSQTTNTYSILNSITHTHISDCATIIQHKDRFQQKLMRITECGVYIRRKAEQTFTKKKIIKKKPRMIGMCVCVCRVCVYYISGVVMYFSLSVQHLS